jgi:DNA-binding XRE family transcriptional regulator
MAVPCKIGPGVVEMGRRRVKYQWDAESIRGLRKYMGLTQQQMAEELGTRQQTISEWETGVYRPRGGMNRLLTLVAEGKGFEYQVVAADSPPEEGAEEAEGEQEGKPEP